MKKQESRLLEHLIGIVKQCDKENQPSKFVLEAISTLLDNQVKNRITRLEQKVVSLEMQLQGEKQFSPAENQWEDIAGEHYKL